MCKPVPRTVTTVVCAALFGGLFSPIIAEAASFQQPEATSPLPYPKMGMMLDVLRIRDLFGVDGVFVAEVEAGSEAERKGVHTADVITEVNHRPVRIPKDVTDEFAAVYVKGATSVDVKISALDRSRRHVTLSFVRDISPSFPSAKLKWRWGDDGTFHLDTNSWLVAPPCGSGLDQVCAEAASPDSALSTKLAELLHDDLDDTKYPSTLFVVGPEVNSSSAAPSGPAFGTSPSIGDAAPALPGSAPLTKWNFPSGRLAIRQNLDSSSESPPDSGSWMTPARKEGVAGALTAMSWKGYTVGTDIAYGELKPAQLLQMLERTPGTGLLAQETNETAAKVAYNIAKNTIARMPVRGGLFLIAIGGGLYAIYQFWHGDTQDNVKSADATRMRALGVTSLPDLSGVQGLLPN